jgi:hypothetical protein
MSSDRRGPADTQQCEQDSLQVSVVEIVMLRSWALLDPRR